MIFGKSISNNGNLISFSGIASQYLCLVILIFAKRKNTKEFIIY